MWILRVGLIVALGCGSRLTAADPFEFQDGDRVVLLGSTLIEREQKYGYWELMLTLKNKDKNVTFRNLGWSGDTVFGEARNGFDESPKGFERLVSLTKELKPTVIFVCYGHIESFEGQAGALKFAAGLEKLLDAIAPTKARIVLMSPTPFENTGPVTDAEAKNKNLAACVEAIQVTAENRRLEYIGLFEKLLPLTRQQPGIINPYSTYNGIHLDGAGYDKIRYLLLDADVATELARREARTAKDQTQRAAREQLRSKVVEKNQLFFHRWRPQNETYLFGFRKHEQGKNAAEVAAFDPLVAKAEKDIVELKKAIK